MTLSLAKQLILPRKMVVSSAKFIILISWSPFFTPLIPCHYQLNGRLLWPKQHSNMEDGHPYQAIKRSERWPIFNVKLNIVLINLYQANEFSP